MTEGTHIPVLLTEVLQALSPTEGEVYVDATFGGGGYTRGFLESAPCQVYGIDRDPQAMERANPLKQAYGERFELLLGTFSQMETLLEDRGIHQVNGIVFDLGISSFQIDQKDRGFSFREDGPLDMRMSLSGKTAADVINHYTESDLADIIYYYGEEYKARRVARFICEARQVAPLVTTSQLATVVVQALGLQWGKTHPATKVFQALRIYVNDELKEIETALEACTRLIKPGGRLVVVSFHSLEDRLVKNFIRGHNRMSQTALAQENIQDHLRGRTPFKALGGSKPIIPSEAEMRANPRSRSAKLRAAIRDGG